MGICYLSIPVFLSFLIVRLSRFKKTLCLAETATDNYDHTLVICFRFGISISKAILKYRGARVCFEWIFNIETATVHIEKICWVDFFDHPMLKGVSACSGTKFSNFRVASEKCMLEVFVKTKTMCAYSRMAPEHRPEHSGGTKTVWKIWSCQKAVRKPYIVAISFFENSAFLRIS